MPNLDIVCDITIAVTWDQIHTSVYGLKCSVLKGAEEKSLATDHRDSMQQHLDNLCMSTALIKLVGGPAVFFGLLVLQL